MSEVHWPDCRRFGFVLVLAWITGCTGTTQEPRTGADDALSDATPSPVSPSSPVPAHASSLASAFVSNPEYEQISISPDGARLAAIASHGSLDQIVVFELDGAGSEPKEIVRELRGDRGYDASRAITMLGWAGNDVLVYAIETALRSPEDGIPRRTGRQESTLSRRQRGIGARARKTRLYSTNLAGKSRYLGKRWQDGPDSQFQHAVIDLLPDDPDHILLTFEGKAVRVNVKNGGRLTLEREPSLESVWFADHAGKIRAGQSGRGWERHVALHARRSDRDPWWTLARYDPYLQPGLWFAGFGADPSRLYVYSDLITDRTALYEYDLDQRKVGQRIAAEQTREADVVGIIQSERDDSLLAVEYCAARCDRVHVDPEFEKKWARIEAAFPDRRVHILDRSRTEERWLVQTSSDRAAPEIAWVELETGRVTNLFGLYPGLVGRELAPMQVVHYKARDGFVIEGYLTRPIGVVGAGPIVVMPHGGPDQRDYWGFNPTVQYLVARGLSVFQPNYRGSTGYGRKFEMLGHGRWGGVVLGDVIDGARALVASGIADPARIGTFGRGFGGYLALQALVEAPELFAAGASFGAVTDLPQMLADDRLFFGQEVVDEAVVLPASGDEDELEAASPVNGAERIRAPVLIGHGSEDPHYPEKHADAMVKALRKAGKAVDSHRYEGDTQIFLDDRHRIDFYSELGDFLTRHLQAGSVARLEDR